MGHLGSILEYITSNGLVAGIIAFALLIVMGLIALIHAEKRQEAAEKLASDLGFDFLEGMSYPTFHKDMKTRPIFHEKLRVRQKKNFFQQKNLHNQKIYFAIVRNRPGEQLSVCDYAYTYRSDGRSSALVEQTIFRFVFDSRTYGRKRKRFGFWNMESFGSEVVFRRSIIGIVRIEKIPRTIQVVESFIDRIEYDPA